MDAAIGTVTTVQTQVQRTAEPALRAAAPTPAGDPAAKADGAMAAERSFDRDAATGSMVYRLIDLSSGIVTIQTPSDARLKLRAYIDGVTARKADPAVEITA